VAALGLLPEVAVERGSLAQRTGRAADLLDQDLTQAVAVPVAPAAPGDDGDLQPRTGTADAAARYGIDLFDLAQRDGLKGAAGEVSTVNLPRVLAGREAPPWTGLPERMVLVGVGDGGPTHLRRAGAARSRATQGRGHGLTTVGGEGNDEAVRAFVEGFLLASYRPPRTGLASGPTPPPKRLVLLGRHAAEAVAAAERGARATVLTRRLAATPSNVKNPAWFAEQARAAAAAIPGTTVDVHDEAWLAERGMGGILAVGGASATPPRFVVVDYTPTRTLARSRHAVLVGKGITFDTGGLSIKDRDSMVAMKTDMAGAAAVLAATLAAAEAELPHRVTAVIPLAENAVGGAGYRPGDVVRTADGSAVEVLNTDAEGRLVLADALVWASEALEPDVVIDVATLTGAATFGLGKRHAALFTEEEPLAAGLLAAGEAAGERLWRMPLVEEYRAALESRVADLANVATDPHVRGGAITAALFLQRFAGEVPWAHLDIAGPARAVRTEHEVTEGPSGFGARLLLRWLEAWD
jgi:leucyl aminopeptidase